MKVTMKVTMKVVEGIGGWKRTNQRAGKDNNGSITDKILFLEICERRNRLN